MTQTPEAQPKAPVEQLAELIDAYATAKQTGNETLVRCAVGPLQQFLQQVDVTPKSTAPVEDDAVAYNGTNPDGDSEYGED